MLINESLPLHKCVDTNDTRQYNMEKGSYSYSGPMTWMFCIVHDFYPKANTFYVDKPTVDASEASNILVWDQDFASNLYDVQQNSDKGYYKIGNAMKAFSNFTASSVNQAVEINFPLP